MQHWEKMYQTTFYPVLLAKFLHRIFPKLIVYDLLNPKQADMDNLPYVLCQIVCMHCKNVIGKLNYKIESGFESKHNISRCFQAATNK